MRESPRRGRDKPCRIQEAIEATGATGATEAIEADGRSGLATGDRNDKAGATRKQYFRRKKVCRFCVEKVDDINYKDVRMLNSFVTEAANHPAPALGRVHAAPEAAGRAIKQARSIALLRTVRSNRGREGGARWKSFSEKTSRRLVSAVRW